MTAKKTAEKDISMHEKRNKSSWGKKKTLGIFYYMDKGNIITKQVRAEVKNRNLLW